MRLALCLVTLGLLGLFGCATTKTEVKEEAKTEVGEVKTEVKEEAKTEVKETKEAIKTE